MPIDSFLFERARYTPGAPTLNVTIATIDLSFIPSSLSLLYSVHNVLFAPYIIRRERESQIGEKRFFSLRLIFFFFFLVTFVG